jgi:hypothetical protein
MNSTGSLSRFAVIILVLVRYASKSQYDSVSCTYVKKLELLLRQSERKRKQMRFISRYLLLKAHTRRDAIQSSNYSSTHVMIVIAYCFRRSDEAAFFEKLKRGAGSILPRSTCSRLDPLPAGPIISGAPYISHLLPLHTLSLSPRCAASKCNYAHLFEQTDLPRASPRFPQGSSVPISPGQCTYPPIHGVVSSNSSSRI